METCDASDGDHDYEGTRALAAQELLTVIQRLAEPAFIYRSFDGEAKMGVVEDLIDIVEDLRRNGNNVSRNSRSTRRLLKALFLLDRPPRDSSPLP